ncbi:MAG TPA: hypothetical protein VE964_02675 [Myxococcales bacterium]|nr:hypothetical protein [Myxococcales bacterium]
MRRTFLLAAFALASAGCPDDLAKRCPPESVPTGHYTITTTVIHDPNECQRTAEADGGPLQPGDDASILTHDPSSTDSILCSGNSDAGPTIYLVVASSSLVRQTPLDAAGAFTFVTTVPQVPSICSCTADLNETISGTFQGGGGSGFSLDADGGLVPQPTGMDGSMLQTLTNPDGGCFCNIPCALNYKLVGNANR